MGGKFDVSAGKQKTCRLAIRDATDEVVSCSAAAVSLWHGEHSPYRHRTRMALAGTSSTIRSVLAFCLSKTGFAQPLAKLGLNRFKPGKTGLERSGLVNIIGR